MSTTRPKKGISGKSDIILKFKAVNISKLLIIIGALFIVNSATYAQETNSTRKAIANSDTLKFTVYGMDCPGCEGGLEKQVNKIPAVKFSKASWINQELLVVVKQDSVLQQSELEKRVKKANFTLAKDAKKE